ncbi:STM3941 family protein [Chryseobacterium terrae]|uniref:STM3941 family protein n=1 Tax=Chryseobacterium terrae TaxID=3163299 RepID=A0ABW8Y4B7_9FLAO
MKTKSHNGEIKIPLSKLKMTLLLLGAVLFVALGLWLIFGSFESYSGSYSRYSYVKEPIFRIPVGLLSVVFFGLCAILIFLKLLDGKEGLIINEKGIFDNSGYFSIGLIIWSDIISIENIKQKDNNFILVRVKNPKTYINKARGFMHLKAMRANYKWYNSPIMISANSLQINNKELYTLLMNKMEEFKN